MASIKQYLDQAGLKKFWDVIKDYYLTDTSTGTSRVGYATKAGNAITANALAAERTISLDGDATGSVNFDGSKNVTLTTTIADATDSTHGLMTGEEHKKLNSLAPIYEVDTSSALTFSSNKLGIDLSNYATKTDITSVFKFKGTKANKAAIEAITDATEGDVWHTADTHTEYVFVKDAGLDGETTGKWEELGLSTSLDGYATENWVSTNYTSKTEEIAHTRISGLEAFIKGTKVDAATVADKVANALTIKTPSNTTGETYDGSKAVTIDISNIATDEEVAKKANKLTATGVEGMILKATSTGDLASTGVNSSVLSGGAIAADNPSFVTGGAVFTAINNMEHKNTTYAFTDGSDGTFKVTPSTNGTAESAITVKTGADENLIEVVKVTNATLNNTETLSTTSTLAIGTAKDVTVDLSSYALNDNITSIPDTVITALN